MGRKAGLIDSEKETINNLRRDDKTIREIARIKTRSKNTINKYLKYPDNLQEQPRRGRPP